jgi:50S ribosomal protein L16 3-hydroxylase
VLALDRELFLRQYWQRQPLLLRGAVADFQPPVSADELAGLALEPEIESRIAQCRGDPGLAASWQLSHGPFTPRAFKRRHPWTLLVQSVDQLLDEVAALRALVDFIPRWRLDDIMVSYASDGGGVGPHYDLYDVFLLQGEGERSWRLGQRCDASTPLLPHPDLKLLAEFHCEAEYTLQCGDVLYIPPGVAHWGISRGESTCFSLGFRAPRLTDLLSRCVDARLESLPASLLLRDGGRDPAGAPGEITGADIDNALQQLRELLTTRANDSWFGELVTDAGTEPPADTELRQMQAALHTAGGHARLAPGARVAWQALDGGIRVFANGNSQWFEAHVREPLVALCADKPLPLPADTRCAELLTFLLQEGALEVE